MVYKRNSFAVLANVFTVRETEDAHEVQQQSKFDYWDLAGNLLTRFHVVTRREKYVPSAKDHCPVDINLLSSERRSTFVPLEDESMEMSDTDDWRLEGECTVTEEQWQGCTYISGKWTGKTQFTVMSPWM